MGIISCGTTLIDQGLYQELTSVDWDTTPKTATFTGVAGNGYFCNTSSGPFTLNLPAGSVGDVIAVSDYASTFNVPQIPATPAVYSNPESTLGIPGLTVSSVSNFPAAPSATVRAQDLYSAVDVGSFTSSDYGVLWETGATSIGFAASLKAGGELYVAAYNGASWQASGQAYLLVDVSSYYNTPGTFYTTIDQSAKQFNLYFQPGGPTSGNQVISLGTSTAGTTTTWAGTDNGALGQVANNMVNLGFTNFNQPFTASVTELRWYYNTAEPSPFQSVTTPATPAVSAKSLTISPNGTDKINGTNENYNATTKGVSLVLLYVDSTIGWKVIGGGEIDAAGEAFITATGGTITTCGDYKIHSFTGPGTFTVTCLGSPTNAVVDYLVIAGGGGGGGREVGGGGGAGGYRESYNPCVSGPYTASPLATPSSLPVTATGYPITVGAGGSGGFPTNGCNGSNSIFSSITSAGGGGGAVGTPGGSTGIGANGGSGGGGGRWAPGSAGLGNTPPVSPPQGNNGGTRYPFPFVDGAPLGAGGGGGAGSAGVNASAPKAGNGGNGTTTSISGSAVTRAGGGGGGAESIPGGGGDGGPGGGGAGLPGGSPGTAGNPATVNTGSGGGGTGWGPNFSGAGGAGGSGIVIIRYKFQ